MRNPLRRQKKAALPVGTKFQTDIPARMDRLPWSPWHLRVVIALGITWVLDGLEVTLVGAVGSVLGEHQTLDLTPSQVGAAGSAYLLGAIVGALVFGRLTDMLGRRRLFLVTLGVYVGATALTSCAWGFWSFAVFRALTGAGIGGEYSAINSAVDELLPARLRGRADLAINSTYWLGTALGAASTLVLLDEKLLPHSIGWRICFGMGAVLGTAILFTRRHLPESPRWLLLHGQTKTAEDVVEEIEAHVEKSSKQKLPHAGAAKQMEVKGTVTYGHIASILLKKRRGRTFLGLTLMVAQAFAYNAVFFTYALILSKFYGVPGGKIGLYLLPFAAGNLLGPLVLGHFFDTVGRRVMIPLTFGLSAVLLAATGFAFAQGWLNATTQTAMWCAVFFVASAAASSAYLTVSELFPVELRGLAIALFYAVGTAVGGLGAPALFGKLVESGDRWKVFDGYVLGAALMAIAAVVGAVFGVPAEGKSLEALAEDGDTEVGAQHSPPQSLPAGT